MNTNESNLKNASKIELIRLPNGWIACDASTSVHDRNRMFAFESTESLQKQLVRVVGKSAWKIEMPERDEKGHFKKQP
jgi:hypothetical protein